MKNFDPTKHEYSIDGVTVPSVTTIAQYYVQAKFPNSLLVEAKAEVGKRTHTTLQEQVVFQKESDVPLEYVEKIKTFLKNNNVTLYTELCEKPIFSNRFQFGGSPDLVGESEKYVYICDYKTGGVNKRYCEMQLAGYSQLIDEYFYENNLNEKITKKKIFYIFDIKEEEVKTIRLQVDYSHVGQFILAALKYKQEKQNGK